MSSPGTPESNDKHLARASLAALLRRHGLVESECKAALSNGERAASACELLAWSHMERREGRAALEVIRAGLAQDPQNASLHYLAAVVHHRARAIDLANTHARTAVTLAPRDAKFRVRLARILADRGADADARTEADHALALASLDSFVCGEVALLLTGFGALDEALALARRRVAQHVEDAWAHAGLMRVHLARREYRAVLEAAEAFLSREPNVAWAWALRAEAYDALDLRADATRAADEALRLDWTLTLGGVAIAERLCARGDWSRAARAMERAIARRAPTERERGVLAAIETARRASATART